MAASATRGAARSVAYTAATYADRYGHGIYPSNRTLRGGSNAARNTVRDALEWMCDEGEAEMVGRRHRGNAEYSFAPLHARHEQIKYWLPIFEVGGSTTDPLSAIEGQPLTPGGQSSALEGQPLTPGGSTTDPEPSVKPLKNHQETNSGLSLSDLPSERLQIEAKERDEALTALLKQLPGTKAGPLREQTIRSIARLEAESTPTIGYEIEMWAARLAAAPELLAVAA